ncbi:LeuA family protein [Dasania sp. GY-MA-18]|uniref:2-isopropylmalate synthase n=1 Tax=Dasania phycosphaerae TaxID=2950436 RepID=A0A9J6RNJ2_9GAMM|nr:MULTISPECIES: LeuA family protein [Dasania]MCR8923481.1 LeuA family protein [Dasania sp. GY-MA-18]MCZ0865914.1 LeuA family protein [Dasania phycosphaerae]MCZ0869639.1 LeuA family protein [Dasania phycosphaerae]
MKPIEIYKKKEMVTMSVRHIKILDTTLRDGEQAPGHEMNFINKLRLFTRIHDLNVDYIEAGFPVSNETDYKLCQSLSVIDERPTLTVFSRPTDSDIKTTSKCITNKENVQLQLLLSSSDIHIKKKRRYTIEDEIENAKRGIEKARKCGFNEISLGLEDSSRASHENLEKILCSLKDSGYQTVVYADTVGCATPSHASKDIQFIKTLVDDSVDVSGHFHDDLGLALANALVAIEAGANTIQTTILGIGERCGNTPIEQLAAVLHYKKEQYNAYTNINLDKLYPLSKDLVKMLEIPISLTRPVVGVNSFSTQAGIHINGLLKDREIYEYVHPEDFGRKMTISKSKHSGSSTTYKKRNEIEYETT